MERVTPDTSEHLLFDDIVFLPLMQAEHDIFKQVLVAFVGTGNAIEAQSLLVECINTNEQNRKKLIVEILEFEGIDSAETEQRLLSLDPSELSNILLCGFDAELNEAYFDPLPNFVFSRDIAVTFRDHILICRAFKTARKRESLLTRFILHNHPIFEKMKREGRIVDMSREGASISIEGGDVMIYEDDYLLVGQSERTSDAAFHKLKQKLFEKKVIKHVVQVKIPHERSCMHIDTIFTQLSRDDFVVFSKKVEDPDQVSVIQYSENDAQGKPHHSLLSFLRTVRPKTRFIRCAENQAPHDEREQWTDGCNLVCVKDGVAIAYDRNPKTGVAIKKAGYTIIQAAEFLQGVNSGKINPVQLEKTVINIPSTELSRGRGGPHCMTCPIERG